MKHVVKIDLLKGIDPALHKTAEVGLKQASQQSLETCAS